MPDKHEVGGSTPLEPTRAAKAARQKRKEERPKGYTTYKRVRERDSIRLEPVGKTDRRMIIEN